MPGKTKEEIEIWERVQRGGAFLDKYIANWRDKVVSINRDGTTSVLVEIRLCTSCVLGLLFATYHKGLARLANSQDREARRVSIEPHKWGFDGTPDGHPEAVTTIEGEMDLLQDAWERYLLWGA